MRLTKYTHACVRLEADGRVLVIDPGGWSEPEAVDGADVVLVTHEHPDHVNIDTLRRTEAPIWTNAAVAAALAEHAELAERVNVVADGDGFTAAGFAIRAFGEDHAVILPELGVPCQNTAFLIDDAIYHPGDSWTRPDRAVHTSLVPVSAPWFVTAEAVEYGREVRARNAVPIHDALISELGYQLTDRWIGGQLPEATSYRRLRPGESIELD